MECTSTFFTQISPLFIYYHLIYTPHECAFGTFERSRFHRNKGAYLQHPITFHPRALILSFLSLHFILTNSSLHFHPLNFIFTNSSPTFYPTPCNPFQIIYYISYSTNSSSSKWDLLFHTFNLIHTISSSSIHSLNFISLI